VLRAIKTTINTLVLADCFVDGHVSTSFTACSKSRVRVLVTIGDVLDWMIGFHTLCTPLGTTGNYSAITDLHTFSSPLHTHYGSQPSLVVSWQRIYNNLQITHEVFFAQSNSSLVITFDCHLQNSTQFLITTDSNELFWQLTATLELPVI
jgi:hypothetical protein